MMWSSAVHFVYIQGSAVLLFRFLLSITLYKKTGKQWPDWMKPGIRVIRGPDFIGTIRKESQVNLGSLSYVPKQVGDNKVHVVWDTGVERSYKSGFTGKYELRAFDIKQVGIEHRDKKCKGCKAKPIRGMRFHSPNDDIDLCTKCYMADEGDVKAIFVRYDTPKDDHVNLPAREGSSKQTITGVFEKSKVIRGPHWCYPSKDGGALDEGTVMSFIPDKDGAIYGWIRVKWDIGKEVGEYRFGANGYVDVVASKTSQGGSVYSDHLPLVGILMLKLGDKVIVNMRVAEFKKAQTDANVPGGWKDDMKQCTNEVGTILELLADKTLARVQYTNSKMFLITKSALYRMDGFKAGCVVKMITNQKYLEALQKGHGKYKPELCGKIGRVYALEEDGDLKVTVEGTTVKLNPTACELEKDPKIVKNTPQLTAAAASDAVDDDDVDTVCVGGQIKQQDVKTSMYDDDISCVDGRMKQQGVKTSLIDDDTPSVGGRIKQQAVSDDIEKIFVQLKRNPVDLDAKAKEMYDALQDANIDKVVEVVRKHKDLLSYKMEGKTIVHLASHEGYKELLSKLIDLGGDVFTKDEEGDTPLHFASYGNRPDCLQVLLQNNADFDAKNNTGTTALSIAVNSGFVEPVQKLVFHNADVTIKGNDGDTAMHDAIEQNENQTIMSSVLSAKTADYSIQNEKGFNVLQWAVFKDNIAAVRIILQRGSAAVIEQTIADGFTALHVAAANDYVEIASLLMDLGSAQPDARDVHQRTPLHLAVIKGRKRVMEVLIEKKADVNATDVNGDTPLHLSQKRLPNPHMLKTFRVKKDKEEINIQITYFLLEKGADISKKNDEGKTAMDYVRDAKLKDIFERLTAAYKTSPAKTKGGIRMPMHWQPMQVTDTEIIALDLKDPAQNAEYNEVAKFFNETLDTYKIHCMKRVQNPLLWEHYTLKKREMEFKYGKGCANELHLYHGTRPELVNVIARDNFDFRIAGSNVGALYGEGSYFATTAKYSDLYAHKNDDGNKVMFVAKVLVGKTAQGKPGLKRPPEVNALDFKKGLYDCCVDNVLRPKIYCVFDMNQYYPEYIIEYS